MAEDVAAALLAAQEAALRADPGLKAAMELAIARIFTVTPTTATPPYVVIGEDQVLDDDTDADGCKLGAEIFSTVHIWDKPEAPQATRPRTIAAAVQRILNAPLALAGHQVDVHELIDKRFQTDPDHSTHVVLVFRYETTPL